MKIISSLLHRPVQAAPTHPVTHSHKHNNKNFDIFSGTLRGVKNGLFRLKESRREVCQKKERKQLERDITKNKTLLRVNVSGTHTEAKINLIHREMIKLSAEKKLLLAMMPVTHAPIKLNDRQNAALIYSLRQSLKEDVSLGKLYASVLAEEINILSTSETGRNDVAILTYAEQRVVDKCFLEKKLAIMDFCAKVLRLHEQADWEPASSPASEDKLKTIDLEVDNHLQSAAEKPEFASKRGIDAKSGLYHERQFAGSGTCGLHANNHYLASWCARADMPFLPLTPRRLEMLLSGLANRIVTESKELEIMAQQRGERLDPISQTRYDILAKGEKYILCRRDDIISYDQKDYNGGYINIARTGIFVSSDAAGIVNRLYGLADKNYTPLKNFEKWSNDLSKLEELEKKQDSLGCGFCSNIHEPGHAICFNKINNQWYLQDSNYRKPIKCRPGEFVNFIAGKTIDYKVYKQLAFEYSYDGIKKLNGNSLVSFYHYEPK